MTGTFIIAVYDNFAVGPLRKLHDENGRITRFEWLKTNLQGFKDEFDEIAEGVQRALMQINSIPNEVPIHIWVSENAHEQTGLLFALYLLRGNMNNITIINTAKLYGELFKSKSKKYIPSFSGEIIPEEFKEIYKYGQVKCGFLTEVERHQFENLWNSLSENGGTLRLWENGEIKSVSEDYYDEFITEMAKKVMGKRKKKVFVPALRIIGEVYGRIEQYVGDDFLEYRLRKLIEKGVFEYEGSLEAMRSYSVKLI